MIEILRTTNQFKIFRQNLLQEKSIGLVPTMGNLHKGHLSLVKECLRNNDITIVSVYVNPKQFGPSEDFEKYPRTLGRDTYLLKELYRANDFQKENKKLVIFAPERDSEIYPYNFQTKITVSKEITGVLCGKNRPGHFDGVTTIVYRLFSIIKPHKAYFGQKDYQQYLVIKKMVEDLELDIQLIPMPVKRDDSGIALSSRNSFLSKEDREMALTLPNTLDEIKTTIRNNPWDKAQVLVKELVGHALKNENWDYLEVLDSSNLHTPDRETHTVAILGAFRVGTTRLIDNKLVELNYAGF